MKKQKLPDTSIAAYKEAQPMITPHHKKIIAAITKLGKANYEQIAANSSMDRHQVGRRLKELEGEGIVCKPGTQSNTTAGRKAYDYSLTEEGSKVDVSKYISTPKELKHSKKKNHPPVNQQPFF